MGSFYQPLSYLNGGKRKRTRKLKVFRGGFYPSVMGGILKAGSYLFPLVMRQGSKMVESHNKKTRKRKSR